MHKKAREYFETLKWMSQIDKAVTAKDLLKANILEVQTARRAKDVLDGLVEYFGYDKILKEKDIVMLVHGGHGFKVIKDVEMIEVKQGPYNLIKDKIKFNGVNEKKIKLKKRRLFKRKGRYCKRGKNLIPA